MGRSGTDTSQARTGTLRGEQVQVKDTSSILADAAEEISLHHSEKVEKKKFDEREVESGDQHLKLMEIKEISEYLEQAGHDDPNRLRELARRMQEDGANPRELARRESRDPSQQYVLLQMALAEAKSGGAGPEVLERLEDAIIDLELESGPQIRAGLNTIGMARETGGSRGGVENFQQTYTDIVLGDNTLSQTLKLALERLGGTDGESLQKGLQGLIKALGADLSSARPSTDPNRLQALVQDLYQLEVTSTVLDGCKELSQQLEQKHGAPGVQPFELMKELVSLTGERWVGAGRFTSLAERFNLREVPQQIAFQMGAKGLVRDLPPKVFPDPETRQTVLDAVQGALDEAIDKEEEGQ